MRTRFALLAGTLVLAVAALVAVTGYLTMRSSLLSRASRTAQGEARRLAASVDAPSGGGAEGQANRVDITDRALTRELGVPGAVVEIRRPDGSLVQASRVPGYRPPVLAPDMLSRCLHSGEAHARLAKPSLSVACGRAGPAGNPVGTVAVGVPLSDVFGTLGTLRAALLLGVVGGAILAAAFALVTARRAIRPIRRIATTAETIRAGDLSKRIDYRGRDELGRLASVLDACFAELEQAIERQRRFGADASHELRTPLASIRANVELLGRWAESDPAARQRALHSLEQASARAVRLIEDLLYLATVERNPPSAKALVRLDEVVLGVIREAGQLREDVAVEVTRLEEATVIGDEQRLQQLLLNVLDNALRVSPTGAAVSIQLVRDGGTATVVVSDRGPGIEPEELARIFDRLYTRSASAGAAAGSGLGLSIAREIARAHGGELSARNSAGAGASFKLTLPAATQARSARGIEHQLSRRAALL
jgi:two-component system, OmpR family, sensor histidine kinase MprB